MGHQDLGMPNKCACDKSKEIGTTFKTMIVGYSKETKGGLFHDPRDFCKILLSKFFSSKKVLN